MLPRQNPMETNIRHYPWYLFFRDCYFWGPAFFLYFISVLTLEQALWLEAVYYVSVAVMEVPSGYISDRFGRKLTLAGSSACMALAYLLFWTGNGFLQFALAQVFLAAGFAAASGTDTALHYESLSAEGKQDLYVKKEGKALRFSFTAGALGAVAGGLVALGQLKWIYGASFIAALVSLGFVFTFTDPPQQKRKPMASMGRQIIDLMGKSVSHRFRFFTFYIMAMTVLMHLPYEFYQPYLSTMTERLGWITTLTPGIAGIHLALTMITGSLFTGVAAMIQHRCKVRQVLLGCALFQVLMIGAMAIVIHPLVAGLLVLRTVSRAIYTPLINGELAPLLDQGVRSTYLSLQSLLGRLSYGVVLIVLPLGSFIFGQGIGVALSLASGLGVMMWIGLTLIPFPQDKTHHCCDHH